MRSEEKEEHNRTVGFRLDSSHLNGLKPLKSFVGGVRGQKEDEAPGRWLIQLKDIEATVAQALKHNPLTKGLSCRDHKTLNDELMYSFQIATFYVFFFFFFFFIPPCSREDAEIVRAFGSVYFTDTFPFLLGFFSSEFVPPRLGNRAQNAAQHITRLAKLNWNQSGQSIQRFNGFEHDQWSNPCAINQSSTNCVQSR